MKWEQFQNFHIDQDQRGVLTAKLDVPGRAHNVFDEGVLLELEALVERLEHDPEIRAVVFTSGKGSGFLAGADLNRIRKIQTLEEAKTVAGRGQKIFDRIENLGVPTVAAIHGPCLGGGLEFALACDYRLARDDSKTRLGAPEVELGLLPAWGGTQRLPQVVGLADALTLILQGKKLPASKAARMGLVDRASPPEQFDADLERFISELLEGNRPEVRTKSSLLEVLRDRTPVGKWLVFRTARRHIASRAEHYPALPMALKAVELGVRRSRQEGLGHEREAFGLLLQTPACHNLMELFFQRERARSAGTWVEAGEPGKTPVNKVAVIGAGTMGAGIAQLAAFQGLEQVVLLDIDQKLVDSGMRRIEGLMNKAVKAGFLRQEEAAARLRAIAPTTQSDDVAGVDLAIEAVTEREDVKQKVFGDLDARLSPGALLATNTSSLSVERLAKQTQRGSEVAGLHFFNPVHKMQLVEVVRTGETSEVTVARLVRLVRRLGKTPIVVADRPGFLVNRILFPYLSEAVRMVCEGGSADEIDRQARKLGMPVGPLELLDDIGLDIAADVSRTIAPLSEDPGPAPERFAAMVQRGWLGRKSGQGFYQYKNGRRGAPTRWEDPGGGTVEQPQEGQAKLATFTTIQTRLVCPLINEAVRCLEQEVVPEPWMVDLGMVLGTGFAPFRGGPLRLADELSARAVVECLERLEQTQGTRFAPAERLREMAEQTAFFYEQPKQPVEPAH